MVSILIAVLALSTLSAGRTQHLPIMACSLVMLSAAHLCQAAQLTCMLSYHGACLYNISTDPWPFSSSHSSTLSLPHRTLGQIAQTKQPFPPLPLWPEDTLHQEKAPGQPAIQQQQFNVPLGGEGKGSAGRGEVFPAGSGGPSRRSLPEQFCTAPQQDTQPRPHSKGRECQRRRSWSRIFWSREQGTLCRAKRMYRA